MNEFKELFWYENRLKTRVQGLQNISKKTKWKRNRRKNK